MFDNEPTIEDLVDGVKETTGLLSKLISRKFGLIVLMIMFVVIILTLALN